MGIGYLRPDQEQAKSPDEMWKLNPIFSVTSAWRKPRQSFSRNAGCESHSCEVAAMSAEWVRRDFRGRHAAWPAATRLDYEM